MKRVISINGIMLDYSLFISSEFEIDDYVGSKSLAIDGSSVVFLQQKGALTKEVQVFSVSSGWIKEDTKKLLEATVSEAVVVLGFSDLTSGNYYYDHTKTPIIFTSVFEGSEWYTVEINLLKG